MSPCSGGARGTTAGVPGQVCTGSAWVLEPSCALLTRRALHTTVTLLASSSRLALSIESLPRLRKLLLSCAELPQEAEHMSTLIDQTVESACARDVACGRRQRVTWTLHAFVPLEHGVGIASRNMFCSCLKKTRSGCCTPRGNFFIRCYYHYYFGHCGCSLEPCKRTHLALLEQVSDMRGLHVDLAP